MGMQQKAWATYQLEKKIEIYATKVLPGMISSAIATEVPTQVATYLAGWGMSYNSEAAYLTIEDLRADKLRDSTGGIGLEGQFLSTDSQGKTRWASISQPTQKYLHTIRMHGNDNNNLKYANFTFTLITTDSEPYSTKDAVFAILATYGENDKIFASGSAMIGYDSTYNKVVIISNIFYSGGNLSLRGGALHFNKSDGAFAGSLEYVDTSGGILSGSSATLDSDTVTSL